MGLAPFVIGYVLGVLVGLGVGLYLLWRRRQDKLHFTNGKLPSWVTDKKISDIQRDYGESSLEANPYFTSSSPKAAKVFKKVKAATGPHLSKDTELSIKEKLDAIKKAKAAAGITDDREERLNAVAAAPVTPEATTQATSPTPAVQAAPATPVPAPVVTTPAAVPATKK